MVQAKIILRKKPRSDIIPIPWRRKTFCFYQRNNLQYHAPANAYANK